MWDRISLSQVPSYNERREDPSLKDLRENLRKNYKNHHTRHNFSYERQLLQNPYRHISENHDKTNEGAEDLRDFLEKKRKKIQNSTEVDDNICIVKNLGPVYYECTFKYYFSN